MKVLTLFCGLIGFIGHRGLYLKFRLESTREDLLSVSPIVLLWKAITNNSCNNAFKVEPLLGSQVRFGEAPHWDIQTQSLYYVDLHTGMLLRYDYKHNKVYRSKIAGEELSSFVIPIEGATNKFVVGCGRRAVIVSWDGICKSCTVEGVLFDTHREQKYERNRLCSAKCDPHGRLYGGTTRYTDVNKYRHGSLYKYENHNVKVVKTDIGKLNGLAWNRDAQKFYYIDSDEDEVKEYDYNLKSGIISGNPKVIYKLEKTSANDHSLLDGMTIDTCGNLYVAIKDGAKVIKINPSTGQVLLEIDIPAKQVTSVAFGGPDLDILYVITATLHGEKQPAGAAFKVIGLSAKGLPMAKVRL